MSGEDYETVSSFSFTLFFDWWHSSYWFHCHSNQFEHRKLFFSRFKGITCQDNLFLRLTRPLGVDLHLINKPAGFHYCTVTSEDHKPVTTDENLFVRFRCWTLFFFFTVAHGLWLYICNQRDSCSVFVFIVWCYFYKVRVRVWWRINKQHPINITETFELVTNY